MKHLFYALLVLSILPLAAMDDPNDYLAERIATIINNSTPESSAQAITAIQELVDEGAPLECPQSTSCPLYTAVILDDLPILEFLVSKGCKLSTYRRDNDLTLLMIGAAFAKKDMCTYLIKQNIDVNARDSDGKTALMYATGVYGTQESRESHVTCEILKLLIDSGADIYACEQVKLTNFTRTALDYADLCRDLHAFMLLLKAGLPLKPFLWAAKYGYEYTTKWHIIIGANPNEPDPQTGNTPIMWAAVRDDGDMCADLIDLGANPYAKNKQTGLSALEMAQRRELDFSVGIMKAYSRNPRSLKHLCINKIRQSVRTQEISVDKVRELPEDLLEHFRV